MKLTHRQKQTLKRLPCLSLAWARHSHSSPAFADCGHATSIAYPQKCDSQQWFALRVHGQVLIRDIISADPDQNDTGTDCTAVTWDEAESFDHTKTLDVKLPCSLWGDLPTTSQEKVRSHSYNIDLCKLSVSIHPLSASKHILTLYL